MKRLSVCLAVAAMVVSLCGSAGAYLYQDGFETPWTGNYATGWDNEGYRWGDAPVAIMQQTATAKTGNYGVKVIADSTPTGTEWWAIVYNANVSHFALAKRFDPYIKVQYYDELGSLKAGQLYDVPDAVTSPDWTDVQFGGRFAAPGNYYYHAASYTSNPPWGDTGVARTADWHELMFQLSSTDGKIHFFLDGLEKGTSVRSDLENLGCGMLAVMFPATEIGNKPYVIFDDFEVGSTAPLPGTVLLLGTGLLGLAILGRRYAKK